MILTEEEVRKIVRSRILRSRNIKNFLREAGDDLDPKVKAEVDAEVQKLPEIKLTKTFASGKYTLKADAKSDIKDKIVPLESFIKKPEFASVEFKIKIIAGTSTVPVTGGNAALAEKRAKSAKDYLESLFSEKEIKGVIFEVDASSEVEKGPSWRENKAKGPNWEKFTKYQFIKLAISASGKLTPERQAPKVIEDPPDDSGIEEIVRLGRSVGKRIKITEQQSGTRSTRWRIDNQDGILIIRILSKMFEDAKEIGKGFGFGDNNSIMYVWNAFTSAFSERRFADNYDFIRLLKWLFKFSKTRDGKKQLDPSHGHRMIRRNIKSIIELLIGRRSGVLLSSEVLREKYNKSSRTYITDDKGRNIMEIINKIS